jgi:DNA-binding MarR family transcriptional regulator
MKSKDVQSVRECLRQFNRYAGVLKTDPYGIGLTLTQGSALVDIERHGSLRPNDLVRLLNLEKSSISRMVSGLTASGYIDIRPDPMDGRAKMLTLTKLGKKVADKINELANKSVKDILGQLTADDQKKVANAFEDLRQVFDQITF